MYTDVQISQLWLLLCMPLMKLAMLCKMRHAAQGRFLSRFDRFLLIGPRDKGDLLHFLSIGKSAKRISFLQND